MHFSSYFVFCLFGAVLSLIRVWVTGQTDLLGLIWNLILAVIPYIFATIGLHRTGWSRRVLLFCWFVFFPNSLYIWTDFLHLDIDGSFLHFDIVYIGVMALAGIFAGFASLELLHRSWNIHMHRIRAWILVSLTLVVAVFGVYLGRFLRFNSWDILHEPLHLIGEIWSIIIHPSTLPMIQDATRAVGYTQYSGGFVNMYGFVGLYFVFYMLLYVFLYHSRGAR